MASGIKIKLSGFDDYIEKIKKANGDVDKACDELAKVSAQTLHSELKMQMQKADVKSSLINRMPPPKVEKSGNHYSVSAGYEKGAYDPNNPSDAYKVIFLNYGTPKRKKHGKIKARGFIQKAKKSATPQIKKSQEKALDEILEDLE